AGDRELRPIPALPMLLELPLPVRGQAVVLRLAIVVRRAPFGFQLAVLLEAVERRKERTRIHLKTVVAERGEAQRDAVAMHGLAGEDGQDHQIERALRDVQLLHLSLSDRLSFRSPIGTTLRERPLGCQEEARPKLSRVMYDAVPRFMAWGSILAESCMGARMAVA